MKNKKLKKVLMAGVGAMACSAGHALEAMYDEDMAEVAGQQGLTITLQEPAAGITFSSAAILSSNPNKTTIDEVGEQGLRYLSSGAGFPLLKRLDTTRPLLITKLDFGFNTNPFGYLSLDMAQSRIDIGAVKLAAVTTDPGSGSLGRYVVDTNAELILKGRNLFDASTAAYGSAITLNMGKVNTALWAPGKFGATLPGQAFWSQNIGAGSGQPEMDLNKFSFFFDMPDGRFGFKNGGLLIESNPASQIGFSLTMDILYDGAGTSPLSVTAADKTMLFWGWRGHQTNFQLTAKGTGGRVDGSGKGINFGIRFDYASDFVWTVGEGGSNPGLIEFGNWTKIPGNPYALQIPFFSIEAVSSTQGTYGLCWGQASVTATANGACSGAGTGPVASLAPAQAIQPRLSGDNAAVAFTVRDMRLAAYSSHVDVLDWTVDTNKAAQSFNWALIYTLADLDADIFMSPYADGKSVRLDMAVTSQTLDTTNANRWTNGSNFMIGDSTTNFGIGLMGADVLLAMRQGRTGMTAAGIKIDAPLFRYELRGMLGGGSIPNMTVPQFLSYVDLNLEADRYVFTLGPAPLASQRYLSYSGYVNAANLTGGFASPVPGSGNHNHDDGTYLSLAEPSFSKLGADFRFANITGSVEMTDGQIDVQGDDVGQFRLLISNNLRIGTTANVPCAWGASCTPAAGNVLQVGRLEFGGKTLGTIVMPNGIVRAQVTIMPQVP